MAAAQDLRQRGNHEFSEGNFPNAVSLYTAAMEQATVDDKILNLCNRSACYFQMEEYEQSLGDAKAAWELSGRMSVKAGYRVAKTASRLQDFDTAKKTIERALKVLEDRELVIHHHPEKVRAVPDRRRKDENKEEKMDAPKDDTAQQRKSLQDLYQQVLEAAALPTDPPETSIKFVSRPISIREFKLSRELGTGNFSEILAVTHKQTSETFALKKIAKKQAADLYKRQHPNVYNEIQMERRVLLERLLEPHHHNYIIRMYHAFQDFENLYYLMDLHTNDLWTQLRYKNLPGYNSGDDDTNNNNRAAEKEEALIMMGCHRSTAKLWLYQLVDALEHMHQRGIVHRDLKAENILLNSNNDIVLIDFGTAKDLMFTDLNGPEFVGTPDFMSPEAVTGRDDGGTKDVADIADTGPAADLWALGALTVQLQTGHTPYWSPSPYLAFLKIKKALKYPNLRRPVGIVDDECWDFIQQLMKGQANERLGANVFDEIDTDQRRMKQRDGGYDCLRQHPYFADVHAERNAKKSKSLPIPSLWDFAVRACAEMAYRDSLDVELCDEHPPGDGSKHDLLRLGPRERAGVMHCLERRRLLSEPRLYARFFGSPVDALTAKVRPASRDVVGLTQMNDDQGKPSKPHDPYAKTTFEPIQICQISSPLLATSDDATEETRKIHTKLLKKCVAHINRTRPHLVVATGDHMNESARKILARVSETIPVITHDGTEFFTFWKSGVQCICISMQHSEAQQHWLSEQLEQERMSKHPLYVFVDADPRNLPKRLLKTLARGRTLALCGILPAGAEHLETTITYTANEVDDGASIRSADSDEEESDDANFTMKVQATSVNGVRRITVEEEPDMWNNDFTTIELPQAS